MAIDTNPDSSNNDITLTSTVSLKFYPIVDDDLFQKNKYKIYKCVIMG